MGAPQSRLYEFAKGFSERGWDVSVVTALPNYPTGSIFPGYRKKLRVYETYEYLDVTRYWLYASNSARAAPRIASMLSFSISALLSFFRIRRYKPDIIFVESPPLTLGFTGYLLARFTRARFALNISDIWPLSAYHLGAISKGFLYRRIEQLERFLYRKSDISSGQSNEIVAHLKENGAQKTFLFRNGVDTTRFQGVEKKMNSSGESFVYAGLLGVAQGVYSICSQINFKELGAEFHIYGEGYEKKRIKNYLAENPDRNIFLHEPVNRSTIPEVLALYDGTIIPLVKNIYGAVPSKIYEAMAAGLPILFSGDGEGAAIVEDHKAGMVSPAGDMEALRENICKFIEEKHKREDYSQNCLAAARNIFDRRKIIDRFDVVLREMVEGRQVRGSACAEKQASAHRER